MGEKRQDGQGRGVRTERGKAEEGGGRPRDPRPRTGSSPRNSAAARGSLGASGLVKRPRTPPVCLPTHLCLEGVGNRCALPGAGEELVRRLRVPPLPVGAVLPLVQILELLVKALQVGTCHEPLRLRAPKVNTLDSPGNPTLPGMPQSLRRLSHACPSAAFPLALLLPSSPPSPPCRPSPSSPAPWSSLPPSSPGPPLALSPAPFLPPRVGPPTPTAPDTHHQPL